MTDKILLRGAARKVFDLITNFFLWSLQSKSRGLEWVKKSQGDVDSRQEYWETSMAYREVGMVYSEL